MTRGMRCALAKHVSKAVFLEDFTQIALAALPTSGDRHGAAMGVKITQCQSDILSGAAK